MLRPPHPASALAALLLCLPGTGDAQTPRGTPSEAPEALLERGDDLHARMRPHEALDAYRRVLVENPTHPGALVRAARECAVLGRLATDDGEVNRWLDESESLARRAVEAAPRNPDAHHRLAAVLQARAERGGIRTLVQGAEDVRRSATRALEEDPGHPGGHHVLGRWHADLARLQGFPRFLARHVLAADVLESASWEDAMRHLERAVEIAPASLPFRMSLAEAYLERDRVADARTQLREILERPSTHPLDPQMKQCAQELLKENP